MAKIQIETETESIKTVNVAAGDILSANAGDNAQNLAVGTNNTQSLRNQEMTNGEDLLLRDIRTLLIGNPTMKQTGLIDEFKELKMKLEEYIENDHANREWKHITEKRLDNLTVMTVVMGIIVLIEMAAIIYLK